jgi:sterol desaturase/sphingolipid hydroxylase (fatty acid hydroxylase superfamily)
MLANEAGVRLTVYAVITAAMMLWEAIAPRRRVPAARGRRWPVNLGLSALDTVLLRLLIPGAAIGTAAFAATRGIGLFNLLPWAGWAELAISVVALDLTLYIQHLTFHRLQVLWRLHRVHHSDIGCDVTTGVRFHPLEILLSMGVKMAAVAALGAPVAAVLLFELLLNGSSLFNHGNVRIPARLDAVLRRVVVTPDMHRVHHSVRRDEHDRNFGFALSCWDRLFGTYRAQPAKGHDGMQIGLDSFREQRDQGLLPLLRQPLR